jgi:hypothetical protein
MMKVGGVGPICIPVLVALQIVTKNGDTFHQELELLLWRNGGEGLPVPEEKLEGPSKHSSPYFSLRGWCPQSWAERGRRGEKVRKAKRRNKTGLEVNATQGKERKELEEKEESKEGEQRKELEEKEESKEGEPKEGKMGEREKGKAGGGREAPLSRFL